jgi:hypothetical protein
VLSRYPNPGLKEKREAEQIVRATLIEFQLEEDQKPEHPEPPNDLNFPGRGQSRRRGEHQALVSRIRTAGLSRAAVIQKDRKNPSRRSPLQFRKLPTVPTILHTERY